MANLSVRKLDDVVYRGLQQRAREHRVSTEEEVRQILSSTIRSKMKVSDMFKEFFGPENGIDLTLVIERKKSPHKPLDLS